jgi:uncharacterized protein (DUF362 family)/Pyruvate/2-oxoacid:ferredoxin oxidoreductase delta subunit
VSSVVIKRCENYDEDNLRNSFNYIWESLGGINKYIKNGTRVVLKPNLVIRRKPEEAATTHPEFVRILSELIIAQGGKVTIAESPGGPFSKPLLKSVYSGTGMESASALSGAMLNYDTTSVKIDNKDGKILKKVEVISALIEADIIINLPKLKAHGQMMYTGAVKNLFGAVPGIQKFDYHNRMPSASEFADVIVDIFLSVKPTLTFMDAIVGMDGFGPTSGSPKQMGLILASEDAFALDAVALDIISVNPSDIPVMKAAMDRNLCAENGLSTVIIGESIQSVRIKDFRMPLLEQMKVIQIFEKGFMRFLVDKVKPSPYVIKRKCISCGDCERNCPAKTIKMINKKPYIDMEHCIRCFCCHELCLHKAINIKRPFFTKFIFTKRGV